MRKKKKFLSTESFDDKVNRFAAALGAVIGDDVGEAHVTLALDGVMRNHMRVATQLEVAGIRNRRSEVIWH
jgi:hypothetical protein